MKSGDQNRQGRVWTGRWESGLLSTGQELLGDKGGGTDVAGTDGETVVHRGLMDSEAMFSTQDWCHDVLDSSDAKRSERAGVCSQISLGLGQGFVTQGHMGKAVRASGPAFVYVNRAEIYPQGGIIQKTGRSLGPLSLNQGRQQRVDAKPRYSRVGEGQ